MFRPFHFSEDFPMYDEEKKPSVAKKIFKTIAYALMAGIYLILAVRIFVSCDSPILDELLKTPAIEEAHQAEGDSFEIRQYELLNWYKSINDGKLLAVDTLYYLPSTENLQIGVKFNKDILPDRDGDYSAEKLPFTIYLEDEEGNRYDEFTALYDERYSFGYIRLNFEHVVFEKNDGTVDENGDPSVHNFEMYLYYNDANGAVVSDENGEKFESFSIYTGRRNYKRVYYK